MIQTRMSMFVHALLALQMRVEIIRVKTTYLGP